MSSPAKSSAKLCPPCRGSGKDRAGKKCVACDGTGEIISKPNKKKVKR